MEWWQKAKKERLNKTRIISIARLTMRKHLFWGGPDEKKNILWWQFVDFKRTPRTFIVNSQFFFISVTSDQ